MTIKGLWAFIKKKHPSLLERVQLREFSGSRILIDGNGLAFSLRMRARSVAIKSGINILEMVDEREVCDIWIKEVFSELTVFMNHGITPVMVFDNGSPDEKLETKQKREETRLKHVKKITDLRDKLVNADRFKMDRNDLETLRRLECNNPSLPPGSIDHLITILRNVGIPTIKGNPRVEAERLCCMLHNEGLASAVWSADSDCLAHGASNLIRGYLTSDTEDGCPIRVVEMIRIERVLEELKMSYESFTHLCILSGCDHNKNIPNMGIGRNLPLIQAHKEFNNFPITSYFTKHEEHIPNLRFEFCNELFTAIDSNELFDIKQELIYCDFDEEHDPVDIFNIRYKGTNTIDALSKVVLYSMSTKICNLMRNVPPPKLYNGEEFNNVHPKETEKFTAGISEEALNDLRERLHIL